MSDHTTTLRCMVEEAAFKHGLAHTEENRRALVEAWNDFLEAYRTDILEIMQRTE